MITLRAVDWKGDYHLLFRFSDGGAGAYDFSSFV